MVWGHVGCREHGQELQPGAEGRPRGAGPLSPSRKRPWEGPWSRTSHPELWEELSFPNTLSCLKLLPREPVHTGR